jgi:hypothetical protein
MKKWLVASLLLFSTHLIFAQAWTGLISTARATDWTQAGMPGGIPSASWTQCGPTIAAYTGSGSTIVNALKHTGAGYTGCTANQYIQLGSGTFTLSSGIRSVGVSNTELRGMGANLTHLVFTAVSTCNGGNGTCGIGFDSSDSTTPGGPPSTIYNWTAGYSQGATSITISNGTGIVANQTMLVLDQCDTGYTGVPCTGSSVDNSGFFECGDVYATTPTGCATDGPDTGFARPHRFEMEPVIVTACSPACGTNASTVVTIDRPLIHPNWTSGQSPQVYLIQPITNVGVQNLSLEFSAVTNTAGVSFFSAQNFWCQGVAVLDSNNIGIWLQQSVHGIIQSNYVYNAGQNGANSDPTGIKFNWANNLIANNIDQDTRTPILGEGPGTGNVIVGNLFINANDQSDFMFAGLQPTHSNGGDYNLMESNYANQLAEDIAHGGHLMETYYRNFVLGWESCANGQCGSSTLKDSNAEAVTAQNVSRYDFFGANVLGTPGYSTTYNGAAGNCNKFPEFTNTIFAIGCGNAAVSPAVPHDPIAQSSTMRWANWDTANGSTQFNSAEVPTSDPNFPNPVPTTTCTSSIACPASFYYSSRPSWWPASIPFPAIGPDVTGGNMGMCSGTINTAGHYSGVPALSSAQCSPGPALTTPEWGGHVYAIPALACYLNVMGGPPDGTGSALSFNAAACYSATITPPIQFTGKITSTGSVSLQ